MATSIAAAAFWLVISAHGVERQHVGPFATIEECGLHRLVTLMRIQVLVNKGVPTMVGDRAWPADAITVDCLPGERPA